MDERTKESTAGPTADPDLLDPNEDTSPGVPLDRLRAALAEHGVAIHSLQNGEQLPALPQVSNGLILSLAKARTLLKKPWSSVYAWLKQLLGEAWPIPAPSVQSVTASINRLQGKARQLQLKGKNSTIIAQLQEFQNDPYTLPQILGSSTKEPPVAGNIRAPLSCCSTSRFNQDAASTLAEELVVTKSKLAAETASREGLQRKLSKSYHRKENISKKLGRRDNELGILQEECDMLSTKLGELEETLERTEEEVATLKGEKISLQKEVHYLRTRLLAQQSMRQALDADKAEMASNFRKKINALEEQVKELDSSLLSARNELDGEIATFSDGRFVDEVRQCCMMLLSHKVLVGMKQVAPVMEAIAAP